MWCLMGKDGHWAARGLMAAGLVASLAGLGAVPAAGSWGRAIEVPGLGALSKGGEAEVNTVSCASAGYCAAGGYYLDSSDQNQQGFVVSERNGRWGKATGIPGLAALNTGGAAAVLSVSCSSAGYCAAGGYYNGPGGDDSQDFVASERNGRWGRATGIPGLAALNTGRDAEDVSVSCGQAGNCAAVGEYSQRSGSYQGFAASERNGRWGKAIEVPGLAALNAGGFADVFSVSCTPAGYCAAGGTYQNRSGLAQGFVASERNGRWGKAIEVPGLGALNTGATADNNDAQVSSVSCPSAGNCAAGGYYTARHHGGQGFLVGERNGRWGKAIEVPGLDALNTGNAAAAGPLSCPSAGNCAVGGYYTGRHHSGQVFLVAGRNGRWGKATPVPGLAALNTGDDAQLESVSCASAGNCAAGGYYTDRHHDLQGFVIVERNGRWSKALEVPGLADLNTGEAAQVSSVSCSPAGTCAAGGYYTGGSVPRFRTQGFVASR
jgi:hypothetical protein